MGYTTAKTTASIPLEVSYTCSKCDTQNKQINYVSEWAEVTKKGTIHRSSTYDKMLEESQQVSEFRVSRRLNQIIDEEKTKRYRAAEFKCKCSYCGYVEPWAKMKFTPIETILGVLAIWMIPLAFVHLAFLLSLVLLLTAWFLFKKIRYAQLEKQISMLPKTSLPTVKIVIGERVILLNPEAE